MNNSAKSDSLIIVLHEIYGINTHMNKVIENFSVAGFDVVCPNLLGVSGFDYEKQEVAYQHFMMNVGFEKSAEQIKKLSIEARSKYKYIFLLGYSIGATIAWLCSNENNNMFDGVIGYYGSRIRDYTEVAPKCPVLLIFPTQEKSFDIKSFVGSFKKTNVDIHILDGAHGFADPFSQNYCEHSFQKANELVHRFLQKYYLE